MIAVITTNIRFGEDWLKEHFEIVFVNKALCWYQDINKNTYQIITSSKQAKGLEFTGMLILPDYDDIVSTVNGRIR